MYFNVSPSALNTFRLNQGNSNSTRQSVVKELIQGRLESVSRTGETYEEVVSLRRDNDVRDLIGDKEYFELSTVPGTVNLNLKTYYGRNIKVYRSDKDHIVVEYRTEPETLYTFEDNGRFIFLTAPSEKSYSKYLSKKGEKKRTNLITHTKKEPPRIERDYAKSTFGQFPPGRSLNLVPKIKEDAVANNDESLEVNTKTSPEASGKKEQRDFLAELPDRVEKFVTTPVHVITAVAGIMSFYFANFSSKGNIKLVEDVASYGAKGAVMMNALFGFLVQM